MLSSAPKLNRATYASSASSPCRGAPEEGMLWVRPRFSSATQAEGRGRVLFHEKNKRGIFFLSPLQSQEGGGSRDGGRRTEGGHGRGLNPLFGIVGSLQRILPLSCSVKLPSPASYHPAGPEHLPPSLHLVPPGCAALRDRTCWAVCRAGLGRSMWMPYVWLSGEPHIWARVNKARGGKRRYNKSYELSLGPVHMFSMLI